MAGRLRVSRNYVSMIEGGREPSRSLILNLEHIEQEIAAKGEQPVSSSEASILREEALRPRELLRAARLRKGLSVTELCKLTGYTPLIYNQIEDGTSQMGEKMIPKVAKALDLDPRDLMRGADEPPQNGTLHGTFGTIPRIGMGPGMEGSKAKYVPLLSMAQAGSGSAWNSDGYTKEGFAAYDPQDKDAFAVTLAGDSMTPVYVPGDVALVYPNHAPRQGDLVIAVLDDEHGGDVMFKIYSASAKHVTLSSYNPAHGPIEFPRTAFRNLFPVAAVTKLLRRPQ